MDLKQFTPILIIGFNRPKTISSLLSEVEKLSSREIWVSIDGPAGEIDSTKVLDTRNCVLAWSKESSHHVKVISRKTNLGIYNHCTEALREFFTQYETGIVLEDHIQFNPEFVKFVDSMTSCLSMGQYWSICGHNPKNESDSHSLRKKVLFRESHIHTIWGWATHSSSVNAFLKMVDEKNLKNLETAVSKGGRLLTRDPLLRNGIQRTWNNKVRRAFQSDSGGGWDNFWVIAGWNSGLPSLLPSHSLSRENSTQTEGQSHHHPASRKATPGFFEKLETERSTRPYRIGSDVPLLKVWGITRLYCWVYFIRILRGDQSADY